MRLMPSLFMAFTHSRVIIIPLLCCYSSIVARAQSSCTIDVSTPGALVAPICQGQQIAEFNYEFQGGLYAQLIANPSFEEASKAGDTSNLLKFWSLAKRGASNGSITSETSGMLNEHQHHCLRLHIASVASGDVGAANSGYWGIKVENNTKYRVSFWARKDSDFTGDLNSDFVRCGFASGLISQRE